MTILRDSLLSLRGDLVVWIMNNELDLVSSLFAAAVVILGPSQVQQLTRIIV